MDIEADAQRLWAAIHRIPTGSEADVQKFRRDRYVRVLELLRFDSARPLHDRHRLSENGRRLLERTREALR